MRKPFVLLGLAAALLGGCGHAAPISAPPASTPPRVVLETYLKAIVAGDCATGRALAVGTFTSSNGDLCGSVIVTAYRIDGDNLDGLGLRVADATEVVFGTGISTRGGGPELPDGWHTWFYSLKKQADGSWRLAGGGTGP